MSDMIGSAHMSQGSATSFTLDRFGYINSALALNGGYVQVPAGYYFNTEQFTVTAWVYPSSIGYWSRVFDFGNGLGYFPYDYVQLSFSDSYSNQASLVVDGTNKKTKLTASTIIELDKWQFFTVTFNGTHLSLYINATLVGISFLTDQIIKVKRTSNFFGKSNLVTDDVSHSYLDDIRFYNISLSQTQIIELMNQKYLTNNFVACPVSYATTTLRTTTSTTSTLGLSSSTTKIFSTTAEATTTILTSTGRSLSTQDYFGKYLK
jgi:hypothetical protein